MNSIEDLRNDLLTNIDEIKTGDLPVKEAEAITNTAGKVLNTVMVQLKYADLKQEKPEIPYLEANQKQLEE